MIDDEDNGVIARATIDFAHNPGYTVALPGAAKIRIG